MKRKSVFLTGLFILVFFGFLSAQNAWINEIHYDNAGTDVDEFIEVIIENAGSYNLSDFSVILYNGSGGASYDTKTLNLFTAGATVGNFKFYWYNYTLNGGSIQNGAPDGMALSYMGSLIPGQFLSYEGTFTATNGPASGITSTDIGVAETSSTPAGSSLQLGGTGGNYSSFAWQAPIPSTPGTLNTSQTLGGTPDPEPTNYPTNFMAIPDIFAMNLSWTDAIGGQLPSAYLLIGSELTPIVNPVDGTPVADDPDLSDGYAVLNINQGIQSASFNGLPGNKTYFFKLFPYTNAGTQINYKTDGTPPESSATTPDVVIINEEDFNAGTFGTWNPVSVLGNEVWSIDMTHGVYNTPCAKMNGYAGGAQLNEDWLISPPMIFNHYTDEHFRFQTAKNYTGPDLEVYISNDYDGISNPNNFTWTQLAATISTGGWIWTPSGSLDVSGTSGSAVYLAFKYTSTNSAAATWEVDEILVTGVPSFSGPTVITSSQFTNITNTSATGGGDVTDNGGEPVTACGLCFGTTANPGLTGPHTIEPGTLGPFTSNLTGLLPNTTYYVRAYATNILGTNYGDNVSVTTLCDPVPPVSDFVADQTQIMIGESINYTDLSLDCPESWNWSFVGGIPYASTNQNPTNIVYNYPGVYNVCLTTTNAYGTHTKCNMGYITVIAPLEVDLVITEIMYNPPESGTDSLEFIEVYNNSASTVNMEGFYFSSGITFAFPNYSLLAGQYVILAVDSAAMNETFGVASFQFEGALNNGGEAITLNDPNGFVIDSVFFDDVLPWDTLADGYGPSLELCNPDLNNNDPLNWRHAIEFAAINAAGDTLWATPLNGCSYPPVPGFIADDTTIVEGGTVNFTNLSTGDIDTYLWTFDGGDPETYDGPNPPAILYMEMGAYDVTLTLTNITGAVTLTKPGYIEVGPTGIRETSEDFLFSVFPNPTSTGSFTLQTPAISSYQISVFSNVGICVYQASIKGKTYDIQITDLAGGVYFVKLTDLNTSLSGIQKLIVQ